MGQFHITCSTTISLSHPKYKGVFPATASNRVARHSIIAHMFRALAIPLFSLICAAAPFEDGAALFDKNCAVCHKAEQAQNRTPTPQMLMRLSKTAILNALDGGVMKVQGAALTPAQREAIAAYLSANHPTPNAAPRANACADSSAISSLEGWNGWGVDLSNSRFQTAAAAGLDAARVQKLKLKWAFGIPDTVNVFGQPSIAGGRLFFGSSDGTVYSIDSRSGCVYWTFKAPATVRTAITLGNIPGGYAAYFGDLHATLYAVNARTGELLWKSQADEYKFARITGAPKLWEGRLYVPVSSGVEEMLAANPKYECCTFRGSVASFDAATGKRLWRTYTIPDQPTIQGKNKAGANRWGPSGAGVWVSPTLDLKRRAIYVGTGNNYSEPATRDSDALLAIDMDTGSVRWLKQMNEPDAWNAGCLVEDKVGCPENPGGDTDIGASPILKTVGGRDLLLVAQKSGVVRALDPDRKGETVWEKKLARGGALGGIMWGMASDDETVYVPISDFHGEHADVGGGIFALKIATGEKVWHVDPAKPACAGKKGCNPSQMAPATLIPGVVFSGSMDGHLRAYATADGKIIWDYDTLRDFPTVNGVKAHGGSLNATGPVIAAGMLFVDSGYGQLGGMGGNVLLAFGPE